MKNQRQIYDTDRTEEELEQLFEKKSSIIYGSILFEEFVKEYMAIYRTKSFITDIALEYQKAYNEDIVLEQAIYKLRKPVQVE